MSSKSLRSLQNTITTRYLRLSFIPFYILIYISIERVKENRLSHYENSRVIKTITKKIITVDVCYYNGVHVTVLKQRYFLYLLKIKITKLYLTCVSSALTTRLIQ